MLYQLSYGGRLPMTRLELATFGLEVQRAIQLRHTGVHEVGFEPTKQLHQILSLTPLTRLGNPCLISGLLVLRRSDIFPLELLETNYALSPDLALGPDHRLSTVGFEPTAIWLKAIRSTRLS